MGIKFLKRRNRKQNEAAAIKLNQSSHRTQSLCDDSTDSDTSRSSKASLAEAHCRAAKWDAVLKLVSESTADEWNAATPSSDGAHPLQYSTSPLHLILAHKAPLKVVEAMIDLMSTKFEVPVPEEALDEVGRTPLHVAVMVGCDEETTLRLLNGTGLLMPAVIKDANGQTPLCLACASPIIKKAKKKSVFAPSQTAMLKWNKRRVMSVLMDEYPEAAAVRDNHGKLPLDYAHEQEIKDSSVQHLARLTKEYEAEPTVILSEDECAAIMAKADVPFIVPSLSGSCRDYYACSILNLDALQDQHIPDASNDISTIGDAEAEMDELEYIFIP